MLKTISNHCNTIAMAEMTFTEMADFMLKLDAKMDTILRVVAAKKIEAPAPELMTLSQAAEFLNRSSSTIYGMVSRQEIPHTKKGKRLSFKRSELFSWLEEGRRKTISEDLNDSEQKMIAINKK